MFPALVLVFALVAVHAVVVQSIAPAFPFIVSVVYPAMALLVLGV